MNRSLAVLLAIALLVVGCGASRVAAGPTPGLDPFDDRLPAVGRLDPDLRRAVRSAAADAVSAGIDLRLTSGWRSRAHQRALLERAVVEYGGRAEALRHVATPDASEHVTGDAVDVGPREAAAWLGRHGSAYGLCQVFANEPWHFELLTTPGGRCPDELADNGVRQAGAWSGP